MYGGVYIGPNGNDVQTPPAVTSRFQDLQLYEDDRYGFFVESCIIAYLPFDCPVFSVMQSYAGTPERNWYQ